MSRFTVIRYVSLLGCLFWLLSGPSNAAQTANAATTSLPSSPSVQTNSGVNSKGGPPSQGSNKHPTTSCGIVFTDVPMGSTFYTYVEDLACAGAVSGYPCGGSGEPCDGNNNNYFRPNSSVTRGQAAKMTSLWYGRSPVPHVKTCGTIGGTIYDAPPGSTFYSYIQQAATGTCPFMPTTPCSSPYYPCDGNNDPYFRVYENATRAEFVVASIEGNNWFPPNDNAHQTFTDVQDGFGWTYRVWLSANRAWQWWVVDGYPCGGTGEPCDGQNSPYFRPNNNLTRGQASKMLDLADNPCCRKY